MWFCTGFKIKVSVFVQQIWIYGTTIRSINIQIVVSYLARSGMWIPLNLWLHVCRHLEMPPATYLLCNSNGKLYPSSICLWSKLALIWKYSLSIYGECVCVKVGVRSGTSSTRRPQQCHCTFCPPYCVSQIAGNEGRNFSKNDTRKVLRRQILQKLTLKLFLFRTPFRPRPRWILRLNA